MSSAKKKLILIDGNALMHRAYHALPPLTTKKGEVVNAVYGFTSVLLKVIKELKPDYMACAFDVAGGTFRDEIFKKYKAGRAKPPQEFYDQIPKIKEVAKALNIPIYEKRGFEADDIIGSLSRQAGEKSEKEKIDMETIIVTGDLDTLQLIDENTKVYTLRKGIKDTVLYDEKAVEERYGLKPRQIIDFKGLRGDPSDNIPGVKGIGEKGAAELLKNFGSVEKLYEAMDKGKTGDLIKPKTKELLAKQKESALMSKKLAAIRLDVDVKLDLEKSKWGNYDKNKLDGLFRELEFYSLISRVEEANRVKMGAAEKNIAEDKTGNLIKFKVMNTEKKLSGFLSELKNKNRFVFRTKFSEGGIADKKAEGLFFSLEKRVVYYIPVASEDNKLNLFGSLKPDSANGLEKVKPVLEDENYKKIGYFFKDDVESLANGGIDLRGLDFDLMLAAYLLDPGKRDYSEEKIFFEHLPGASFVVDYEEEADKKIASAEDIINLNRFFDLQSALERKLKEAGMKDLFHKIEMPLIKALAKMEMNGVKLDTILLKELSLELKKKISKLDRRIHELSGDDSFNINSSQQLSAVLFEKMKLSTADIKKTQTRYSTAATELEKLKSQHIIIDFISQYRELVKLKNTYVDALPKLVSKKTGRLHTTFHQTVTATGRLSSSDPNLQNIPVRTEIGRKMRKAFIADKGRKLLSADYSQIELRIIAMIADDKKMKDIFNKGLDIHAATAAEINQVPIGEVTSEMRRAAKALNFGVIYGMGVFGFAEAAGVDRARAKEFIDNYMKRFSSVAEYIERSKEDARKLGYAQTLLGRRRYLPELKSSNAMVRNAAERMAINMPIQGTAADIMKIAMIRVDDWIKDYNKQHENAVNLLLQVHDELLFSIKEENVKEAAQDIKKVMENGHLEIDGKKIDFDVPIVVDIKAGDNWEEMEAMV